VPKGLFPLDLRLTDFLGPFLGLASASSVEEGRSRLIFCSELGRALAEEEEEMDDGFRLMTESYEGGSDESSVEEWEGTGEGWGGSAAATSEALLEGEDFVCPPSSFSFFAFPEAPALFLGAKSDSLWSTWEEAPRLSFDWGAREEGWEFLEVEGVAEVVGARIVAPFVLASIDLLSSPSLPSLPSPLGELDSVDPSRFRKSNSNAAASLIKSSVSSLSALKYFPLNVRFSNLSSLESQSIYSPAQFKYPMGNQF
jgi:hypothetical protein